jgi:asparagine synthase (glutamine-hydrolysing)
MCGIAVVASPRDGGNAKWLVARMLAMMDGRGDCPPDLGALSTAVFGCRRLAIVDRERGAQPMYNEARNVAVVFNGEIYNHRVLADELREAGHELISDCDTEVLVHGYEEWGDSLPARLRGMYAFVVVDERRGRIFAARDPFGIKPLYYARAGDQLLFASEIEPLVACGCSDPKAVPPGGCVDDGEESPRRFFPEAEEPSLTFERAAEELRGRLRASVRSMLETDLPLAVFLSGGIDSSAVLYEVVRSSADATAYTVAASDDAPDAAAAERVARALGAPLRIVRVTADALLRSIPEVVIALESFEPNHIRGGCLSYALARAAHEDGFKVALCGEGADELLAGYPELADRIESSDPEAELRREIDRFARELHRTQLQRVDRSGMSFAVEVRVPYLDLEFARLALGLPAAFKIRRNERGDRIVKWVLREAYRGLLPDDVVDRRKVVLSEGAGVGDNSACSPFFEYARGRIAQEEYEALRAAYPEFGLCNPEEAFYFSIFRDHFGALPIAAQRPRVNQLPT